MSLDNAVRDLTPIMANAFAARYQILHYYLIGGIAEFFWHKQVSVPDPINPA
jgi:hypothetical protein